MNQDLDLEDNKGESDHEENEGVIGPEEVGIVMPETTPTLDRKKSFAQKNYQVN